jgi:hypothetical protein
VAFLFADLIVLPILDIDRKYYGLKVSAFLFIAFYAAIARAALVVEFIFGLLHLVPQQRNIHVMEESIRWNYTSILNVLFLGLAVLLLVQFLQTGGPEMLRMMNSPKFGGHHQSDVHQHHSNDEQSHHHDGYGPPG